MKYRYSIITFDFNNYEIIHEIENPREDVEYIYVTNTNKNSKTWKIVNFDKFNNPIESLMYVKYHPFEFVSSDICVVCDGSTKLLKDGFEPIYKCLTNDICDLVVKQHPDRNDLIQELYAWNRIRNYSIENVHFYENYLKENGIFKNNVFEINVYGIKNNEKNNKFLEDLYNRLITVKYNENVCRMDQVMFTYLITNIHKTINYYMFDLSVELSNKFFIKCQHGNEISTYNSFNTKQYLIPISDNICKFF